MTRPGPKKEVDLTVRVPRVFKDRVKAEAELRGMSMSEYVRRALDTKLDEDEDRRARNR